MAVNNQTILLKLEKSEAYFAEQIDKKYQGELLGISIDCCKEDFLDCIFSLINALRFRIDRDIYDDTSIDLYNKLERELPFDLYEIVTDPDYISIVSIIVSGESTFRTFLSLLDTPDSYSGQANKIVSVKSDTTGLEFIELPVITADNGLTKTNNNIQLGGNLINFTTVGLGQYGLDINGAFVTGNGSESFFRALRLNEGDIQIGTQYNTPSGDNLGSISNNILIQTEFIKLIKSQIDPTTLNQVETSISISPGNIIELKDETTNKGAVYSLDYSAVGTLDDRWVPDWGAVKSIVPDVTGFIPYTGGTSDVDLGIHRLTTTNLTILTTPSLSTDGVRLGDLGNYVDKTTVQTGIAGAKTWTGTNTFLSGISVTGGITSNGGVLVNGSAGHSNNNNGEKIIFDGVEEVGRLAGGGLRLLGNRAIFYDTSLVPYFDHEVGSNLMPYLTVSGAPINPTDVVRLMDLPTITEPFTDVIIFTYNGSNNTLTLSFTPVQIGTSFKNGVVLNPYTDFSYSGLTMILDDTELTIGIEYTIITQYFK